MVEHDLSTADEINFRIDIFEKLQGMVHWKIRAQEIRQACYCGRMMERFLLTALRPNNWYLNQEKVRRIREAWDQSEQDRLPPVLVARIDDAWALIDGHSRAWVARERGAIDIQGEILSTISPDEWRVYEIIHRQGPSEGVRNLEDLSERMLSPSDYEEKWIRYCRSLNSF